MVSFTRELVDDPSSLSNPSEIVSTDLKLSLAVDFEKKIIHGTASYKARILKENASVFTLDTANLVISKVEVDGARAKFQQRVEHEVYGSALDISFNGGRAVDSIINISITYHTTPKSSAVQWLPPNQTAGKMKPYLFTQCQAIHARSLLPCQDTPSVKMTYEASVEVPDWATCLMSALPAEDAYADNSFPKGHKISGRIFYFHQPVPISSYLIAIAVGDLAYREISPRCKIWSEPSMVEAAAHDFSQTEDFLKAAEELTCPYQWTRYDVLCLPPSFPYGGMENPCLTFVTPTLLSGDRSLACVIAHEIAHSWTGNLITNRTWQSFWLNEGFTMWLERKIMSKVTGNSLYYDNSALLGWDHLKEDVDRFEKIPGNAALTALCAPLTGIDPDDSFSSVPYEKGFALLNDLQQRVGITKFEEFVKEYIQTFKFGVIDNATFYGFVNEKLSSNGALDSFDWEYWLFEPGMPKIKPNFDTTLCAESWSLASDWINCTDTDHEPSDTRVSQFNSWPSIQKVLFLTKLLEGDKEAGKPLTMPVLLALDRLYGLSSTGNSEVKMAWCMLCLRSEANFIVPVVVDFITSQGRMKFTRPLYRELSRNSGTEELAKNTFLEHSDFYHPICRAMIAKDIGMQLPRTLSRSLSRKSLSCEPLHALNELVGNEIDKKKSTTREIVDPNVGKNQGARHWIVGGVVIVVVAVVIGIVIRRK